MITLTQDPEVYVQEIAWRLCTSHVHDYASSTGCLLDIMCMVLTVQETGVGYHIDDDDLDFDEAMSLWSCIAEMADFFCLLDNHSQP